MPRPITIILPFLLGAGLAGGLTSPSSASIAGSTKQFCAEVSQDGGTTRFVQAATNGDGAADLATSLQALDTVAPKQVKSAVATMAKSFTRIGQGEKVSDLGAKNVAKLNSAMKSLSAFVSKSCTSAGSSSDAATAGALSGTWSGQYSGPSDGTFTLTWQQSGSNLTGTISISELGDVPININGNVAGGKITFGTVGSLAITYSGSASGNTMSGTYHAPNGDGTWSATKGS